MLVLTFIGLLVAGGFLRQGKGAFLIAGYNTMSPEEKAQYDTLALCRFMGNNMFVLAGSMIFYLLGIWLDIMVFFYIGTAIILITCIFMAIYTNTGNRFKKK